MVRCFAYPTTFNAMITVFNPAEKKFVAEKFIEISAEDTLQPHLKIFIFLIILMTKKLLNNLFSISCYVANTPLLSL